MSKGKSKQKDRPVWPYEPRHFNPDLMESSWYYRLPTNEEVAAMRVLQQAVRKARAEGREPGRRRAA